MTTEVKTGTVEGVSKFGVLVDGVWYNPDKFKKPSFGAVRKGDLVTLELNSGSRFFVAVSGGSASPGSLPASPAPASLPRPRYEANNGSMARSVALKAAVEYATKFSPDSTAAESDIRRLSTEWADFILGEKSDA